MPQQQFDFAVMATYRNTSTLQEIEIDLGLTVEAPHPSIAASGISALDIGDQLDGKDDHLKNLGFEIIELSPKRRLIKGISHISWRSTV